MKILVLAASLLSLAAPLPQSTPAGHEGTWTAISDAMSAQ